MLPSLMQAAGTRPLASSARRASAPTTYISRLAARRSGPMAARRWCSQLSAKSSMPALVKEMIVIGGGGSGTAAGSAAGCGCVSTHRLASRSLLRLASCPWK